MVVIGLLLIAAAVAVAVGVLLGNTAATTVEVFGWSTQTSVAGVFVAGAAAMLTLLLGLWMLLKAMSRARQRRAQRKALARDRGHEVSQLEQDRARLAEEKSRLEQELAARDRAAAPTRPQPPVSDPSTGSSGGATAAGAGRPVDLTAREQRARTDR